MAVNAGVRSHPLLWNLRLVQAFAVLSVLAVAASNSTEWSRRKCGVPAPIHATTGAAVLTAPFILYFIASTSRRRLTCLPWHRYAQLLVDTLLLVLWTCLVFATPLTCEDACNACSHSKISPAPSFHVWMGDTTCGCNMPLDGNDDNDALRRAAVTLTRAAKMPFNYRPGKHTATTKRFSQGGIDMRAWVSWAMVVLLLSSIILTLTTMWKQRNNVQEDGVEVSYADYDTDEEKKSTKVTIRSVPSGASTPTRLASSPSTPRLS